MSDYRVVLGDLESAAREFGQQEINFRRIAEDSTKVTHADTGDMTLTQAVQTALSRFSVIAQEFSEVIGRHSTRLQDAHDDYKQTDADTGRLLDKLKEPDVISQFGKLKRHPGSEK